MWEMRSSVSQKYNILSLYDNVTGNVAFIGDILLKNGMNVPFLLVGQQQSNMYLTRESIIYYLFWCSREIAFS